MSIETLNNIADWALLSALPAVVLFPIFYSRSDWRSTPAGRALMTQAIGMTLIVVIVVLSLFLGTDYPGRWLVRLIGYSVLSFALWRMLYVLRKYQREGQVIINPFRRKSVVDAEKRAEGTTLSDPGTTPSKG